MKLKHRIIIKLIAKYISKKYSLDIDAILGKNKEFHYTILTDRILQVDNKTYISKVLVTIRSNQYLFEQIVNCLNCINTLKYLFNN